MRHEGVAPSNNLIKDATHRATVFVGPTLKSFVLFSFREIYMGYYEKKCYTESGEIRIGRARYRWAATHFFSFLFAKIAARFMKKTL